ncbi:hypothetical protein ACO0RG_000281 [Hanseniaspora osmophila]
MEQITRSDSSSSSNTFELQDEHNRIVTSDNEEHDDIMLAPAESVKTEDHNELYDHRDQNYSVLKPQAQQMPENEQGRDESSRLPSFERTRSSFGGSDTHEDVHVKIPTPHGHHRPDAAKMSVPHMKLSNQGSTHDIIPQKPRRKSVASSINSMRLNKTKSNTSVSSTISKTKHTNNNNPGNANRGRRNSMDSDDSNDTQETEEDVCFPLIEFTHDRVNGIDFDELEEYARDEIQFNLMQQQIQQAQNGVFPFSESSSTISKAALKYTPSVKTRATSNNGGTAVASKAPTSASAVIAPPSKNEPQEFEPLQKKPPKEQKQNRNFQSKNAISFGYNKVENEDTELEDSSVTTTTTEARPKEFPNNAGIHNYEERNQTPYLPNQTQQYQQEQQGQQNSLYHSAGSHNIPLADFSNPASTAPVFESMYHAPDRFSFFLSEMEETIHAPSISSLLQKSGAPSFKTLFQNGEPTWWLDCVCPTDEEMKCISKCFGIHPLTAEDIRMQESREKVELFKHYYFVCFHTFENDMESEDFLEPINVYIVVFANGVLTFHFGPEIVHCANVRKRVRQLRDYVNVNSDWLCYALIDDITDSFAPVIRSIEYEADVIEDSVFMARDLNFADMLQRIGESRRKTMTLMRLLAGKADVIKMFAKRCQEESKGIGPALTSQVNIANLTATNPQMNSQPRADIALYLGDIQDHVLTMYQNLLSYEKIFGRSHANYLAQLQVESFNSNNKVTEMLSRVTMLGTLLVPLNIIPGLFGMNVRIPGDNGSNLGWFFGIIGVLIIVSGFALWFSKYWLNKIVDPETLNEASAAGKSTMSTFKGNSIFNKSVKNNSRTNVNDNLNDIQSRLPPLPRHYSFNKKPGYARSVNSLPSKYGRYE